MNPDENGDWTEWRHLVLKSLRSLEGGLKETRDEVGKVRTEMAVLKVKAGVWGALAGAVPAGVILVLHYFTGRKQ